MRPRISPTRFCRTYPRLEQGVTNNPPVHPGQDAMKLHFIERETLRPARSADRRRSSQDRPQQGLASVRSPWDGPRSNPTAMTDDELMR